MVDFEDFKNACRDAYVRYKESRVKNFAIRPCFWNNNLTYNSCKRVFSGAFYDELSKSIIKCTDMPNDVWCVNFIRDSKTLSNHVRNKIIKKKCPNCGEYKPAISGFYCSDNRVQSHCIECSKSHGRLRNGSTGVYRNPDGEMPIALFSDVEIMEEVKRRSLLTVDLAIEILREGGMKGEIYQTKTYTL